MTSISRAAALSSRWKALFHDHEIFVRTGGDVRFLRMSAAAQRRAATIALVVIAGWLLFTLAMLGWQAQSSLARHDVAVRAVSVAQAEARVAATSGRTDSMVRDLGARQDYIENLYRQHFGTAGPSAGGAIRPAADPVQPAAEAHDTEPHDTLGSLDAIDRRQRSFIARLTTTVLARSARAESALRAMGIRPGRNAGGPAGSAQGGPFVPWASAALPAPRDLALQRLSRAFARMDTLEQLVLALPANKPAEVIRLSSGFGYRSDPFTGAAAMHAGIDFTGAHGSPIHAAAAGRISFAGTMQGYGNVMEIDHGHGIVTRYAHLSGFVAPRGTMVMPGDVIARMGSTGRSTGTHLHFEVRVGGTPVNPRPFLESNSDVLQIQADAGNRVRSRAPAR